MMIAPPAMVEIALAIWEPPCCSRIARPSDTAPQTTRNPPKKVTHPDTRVMICASIWIKPFFKVRQGKEVFPCNG